MSTKSILAKTRNYSKFRIKGISNLLSNISSLDSVTREEKEKLLIAKNKIEEVLSDVSWDLNTVKLGLTPTKIKKDVKRTD